MELRTDGGKCARRCLDSWQVKICAVANGASATIAHLPGYRRSSYRASPIPAAPISVARTMGEQIDPRARFDLPERVARHQVHIASGVRDSAARAWLEAGCEWSKLGAACLGSSIWTCPG